MAPIRRYLRITKYSVLEVRIYLENPAHTETWLLRRSGPALPRIIESVRPLVLPKLREESERARGNKKSKKGIKDVVTGEDFEVSIYLTELSSRHSLLTKHKHFEDKPRIRSNSNKLTNWLTTGTSEKPVEIVDSDNAPIVIREESDREDLSMADVPEAAVEGASTPPRRASRRTGRSRTADTLFVNESSDEDEDFFQTQSDAGVTAGSEKASDDVPLEQEEEAADDKKKPSMSTVYDGFSIYGRILCLVVKRTSKLPNSDESNMPASSQQMLENWVSTQAMQGQFGDEEEG